MKKHVLNAFTTGMDKDSDKSIIRNTSYLHAENFRLVTDEGNSTGALTNIKGTLEFVDDIPTDHTILGHCYIRDELILFTKGATDSYIYRVTFDETSDTPVANAAHLIAQRADLNFDIERPIIAIGRYENENIKKVYWSDGVEPLRVLNTADYLPDGTENNFDYIANIPLDLFSITPNSRLNTIQLTNVVGGSLKSGVIQYAYQLFIRNGAETTFSPLSPVYHLSDSSHDLTTNKTYGGSPQFNDNGDRVNTNKGLEIKISNIDNRFDRIRIISIHYSSLYDVPEISIIHEGALKTESGEQTLTVIDTGSISIGNYTLEELSMIGQLSFSAKVLETKDNRLFIGNVTEEYTEISDADFDARAYRFRSLDNDAIVYDSNLANPVTIDQIDANWGVSLTHDAVNIYNTTFEPTDQEKFIYRSNGTTLGGQGPNVSYKFAIKQIPIDNNGMSVEGYEVSPQQDTFYVGTEQHVTKGYPDYSSPFKSGLIRGYQRDEVYRFGIVLFDKKMRPLPVKWIGDIKMPAMSDVDSAVTYTAGGTTSKDYSITSIAGSTTYANVLYLQFDVNLNEDIKSKTSGYQIVRCKRQSEDRSVVASGLLTPMMYNNLHHEPYQWRSNWESPLRLADWNAGYVESISSGYYAPTRVVVKDLVDFISPEINFNKNLSLSANDFVKIDSVFFTFFTIEDDLTEDVNSPISLVRRKAWNVVATTGDTPIIDQVKKYKINDLRLLGVREIGSNHSQPNYIVLDTKRYIHYVVHYDPDREVDGRLGHKNTSAVLVLENEVDITATEMSRTSVNACLYASYRREVTPYGGNTHSVRSFNKYIAASHFVPFNNTSTVHVYGGDTFIGMFDHLRTSWDQVKTEPGDAKNYRSSETISFPVETSINLNLRHDKNFNKLSIGDDDRIYLQEEKTVGEAYALASSGDDEWKYSEDYTNLYLYNSVYSRDNDAKVFFAEPFDNQIQSIFDTRVYSSELKRNGEYSDSWTRFMPNDYIDLDSTYGTLIELVNYKDRLVFFQEKGFGILSVNYQSVLQDINSRNIVLGSGGLLDRADYISTSSGTKHRTSVTKTPYGLFWFDSLNKKVYRMNEAEEPISDIKGLNSYFQENIKASILHENKYTSDGSYVLSSYDDKFMEVLFTFFMKEHEENSFTLAFNVKLDNFTSFYTFIPKMYIEYNKQLLSTKTLNDLWIHNYGNYGMFHTPFYSCNPLHFPAPSHSIIKFIVNEEYYLTKTFDVIQYNSESNSGTINIHDDTFDSIRCYTDYQNTGYNSLSYTEEDINVVIKYGYLYNWFALDNITSHADWRVPTRTELIYLFNYVGSNSGDKLKSTRTDPEPHPRWVAPNSNATNEYDFSGYPGGRRTNNGTFEQLGQSGFWWTSSETSLDPQSAWYRFMLHATSTFSETFYNKLGGMSVRLVRDAVECDPPEGGTDLRCTDYIGNNDTSYETVRIGDYVWTVENLVETKYRNGTPIPEVQDGVEWAALATGARCSYANTEFYSLVYYYTPIERRERTWSLHVPRNAVSFQIEDNKDIFDQLSLDPTRLFKSRLRDKYMIIDLMYYNEDNYKFTIPGIITKYRISPR